MKRIVLFKRLLQPLLVVGILAVFTSAFYMFSLNLEATQKEASYETEKLEHVLTMAKNLVSERVYSSMELLKQKSYLLGLPTINGEILLNRESVPNLQFGHKSQANQTYLVDYVTNIGSGTATLFVKKDDAFIRIATNVRQKTMRAQLGQD